MTAPAQVGRNQAEAGSALLIAIFALLLISVVGIALLVSSGTGSALAGNYRTSTSAYYAALAGLEEARGRLLPKNPAFINTVSPNFIPTPGAPSSNVTNVLYIRNPGPGETDDPTNPSDPYADKEYDVEFPNWKLAGATVFTPISSVSALGGLPAPYFKWVRINPVTEGALGIHVDGSTSFDIYTPLFYSGMGLNRSSSGNQAFELTALAVLPSGGTRLLQYVVAPVAVNMSFNSALTIAGNGVTYLGPQGTDATNFYVNGNDPGTGPASGKSCTATPSPPVWSLGYTDGGDQSNVSGGTSGQPNNYIGLTPPTPSVGVVSLPWYMQKPSQLDALIRSLSQNADLALTGPATRSQLPTTMSPTNPMTIIVNGDLDLTTGGPHLVGYGLLVVTGTLHYDPDVSWEGVVLVVGKGIFVGSHGGSGRFDGAMLVAQIYDPVTNNLLPDPSLGATSVTFDSSFDPYGVSPLGNGAQGIFFNSCLVSLASAPLTYKVLSFRELTQ
jgi:hypothetical protein